MSALGQQYVERYYREYDDSDRYFDLIYDLYEQIQESQQGILNNNKFEDFFNFCISHMDRNKVDEMIINQHLVQLSHEIGCRLSFNPIGHSDDVQETEEHN